jgi:hypothetical protein
MVRVILTLFLFSLTAQGAISADAVWEVRSGGNADNGGCFVDGATGMDYSQQDAAEYTFADLVLDTTTTVSSASHAFDNDDIGNCLHITAGTGFTVGFYEILSQAAGVATLDRAAGTMGSTGGTFFVGGAIISFQVAFDNGTSFNDIWVRDDADYSVGSALSINAARSGVTVTGYGTTRGDGGRPTLLATTNTITMLTISNSSLFGFTFQNFTLDCDAPTRSGVAGISTNNGSKVIRNVTAMDCQATSIILGSNGFTGCYQCSVSGQTAGNSFGVGSNAICMDCHVTSPGPGTGQAFSITGAAASCIRCVGVGHANATTSDVFGLTIAGNIDGGVCYNAGRDCLRYVCSSNCPPITIRNFIAWTANGFCITSTSTVTPAFVEDYNGLGNCTLGERSGVTAGANDVSLTADPFTSAPTDLSLNDVAGGGSALKGVGFPGVTPVGTGFMDIGALQSQATGGGTPTAVGVIQ